jgi:hypothetical protein
VVSVQSVDTAVVGAGPYGLSIAAHLRARGADFAVFGPPLATWRAHMPKGMSLKSDGFASSLSAPEPGGELYDYCAEHGLDYHPTDIPVPLATFVDYAMAFQRRWVPALDTRRVAKVARDGGGYVLALEDGERLWARRVVVAAGVSHFARTPGALAGFAPGLVSHAADHHRFEAFAGRDVTVLGAGSSAVDVAVALAEAGAKTRLVARRRAVKFGSPPTGRAPSCWSRIRHPTSGLGPGLRSRLACDAPDLFRLLPIDARVAIIRRHLGPSSPFRMKAPFEAGAEVLTGLALAGARPEGSGLRLSFSPTHGGAGYEVVTDHLICATGYEADLDRLEFLDADLRARLRRVGAAPAVSTGFESSSPGLYFTGLAAVASFGPLMRFMFGADFASRRITARLVAERRA